MRNSPIMQERRRKREEAARMRRQKQREAAFAKPREGDLRVWWVPQAPSEGDPFYVAVPDHATAAVLLRTLADYDLYQLDNHIKPDYANTGGLEVFECGEWCDWRDDEGRDIDEVMEAAK